MWYVFEISMAEIVWTGPSAGWYPIYVTLEPWIPRFALLLLVIGVIQMFHGYAGDGAYGITKGMEKAVAGVVIAALWVIAKRIYA